MNNSIDCSIIVPVYYNEGSLENLYELVKTDVINKNTQYRFETIFIDDGSRDKSLDVLLSIRNKNRDQDIKIIQFTRNFGQINATYAGMKHAMGKCFVYLSADIQNPPFLINEMLNNHFEENYEIVIGIRTERHESFYKKITSSLFYYIIKKLAFSHMPKGGFDYVLHGSKIKEYLINNYSKNSFSQGMLLWTGYKIKQIPYTREARNTGKSQWTFSRKLKYLIDGIFSYSFFPIRMISYLGVIIALTGFIYAITILIAKVIGNVPYKGWAPLMILILVLSGIQMIMLGVIGEYLWRTFDQVRNKEPYLIEKIYE